MRSVDGAFTLLVRVVAAADGAPPQPRTRLIIALEAASRAPGWHTRIAEASAELHRLEGALPRLFLRGRDPCMGDPHMGDEA